MTLPRLTGNRCQCPACGLLFANPRGFDRHRTGSFATATAPDSRRCLALADLLARGWTVNGRGFLLTPDRRRAGAALSLPNTTEPLPTPLPGNAAAESQRVRHEAA
jgi:hypothetical protein